MRRSSPPCCSIDFCTLMLRIVATIFLTMGIICNVGSSQTVGSEEEKTHAQQKILQYSCFINLFAIALFAVSDWTKVLALTTDTAAAAAETESLARSGNITRYQNSSWSSKAKCVFGTLIILNNATMLSLNFFATKNLLKPTTLFLMQLTTISGTSIVISQTSYYHHLANNNCFKATILFFVWLGAGTTGFDLTNETFDINSYQSQFFLDIFYTAVVQCNEALLATQASPPTSSL